MKQENIYTNNGKELSGLFSTGLVLEMDKDPKILRPEVQEVDVNI